MKIDLFSLSEKTLEDIIYYIDANLNLDLHNDFLVSKVLLSNKTLLVTLMGKECVVDIHFFNVEILSFEIGSTTDGLSGSQILDYFQKYTSTISGIIPKVFRIDFANGNYYEFESDEAFIEIGVS